MLTATCRESSTIGRFKSGGGLTRGVSTIRWRPQPFRVRMSWRKRQHPRRRQTQNAIGDGPWPRSEHVLLTSEAHDNEPSPSLDSDLRNLLGRGSHRNESLDIC
jgi:hypothetical protein